jgi:DNA invertase Pin-like site-specific DNA recombinase
MRAVIYARYSTEQQREASIDDQVRECKRLAVAQGSPVVDVFQDRGISAGTAQRPGYQAMLEAARRHEFDLILVEDVSRLWRSGAEFGPRAAELSDLGVHLLTLVGDDTRRDGWGLMLAIKQAMAEHARREISYRTRRGLEGLALAGKPTGGRVYGFSGGQIEPAEAARVQQMFELAAAGMSQSHIAAQLNREGVPTVRGGRWSQSTVSGILRNARYAGRVEWGRTSYRGTAADSARRRRIRRPDGVAVQVAGPVIVSEELFAKVVDRS